MKKVYIGIAALAVAAVAGLNMNFNSQKSVLSGVALANIEALAGGWEKRITIIMKAYLFYVCALFLFAFYCCQKEKTSIVEYFEDKSEYPLQSAILLTDDKVYNPLSLVSYNDTLLILHNAMSPTFFSLVNIQTKEVVKDFGTIGNGPGEFVGCLQIEKAVDPGFINTADNLQARMYQYSLDSILSSNKALPINLFTGAVNENTKNIYSRILQIDDSIFIGMPGRAAGRFVIFNKNNHDSNGQGEYPKNESQPLLSESMIGSAYQGYLHFNRSNQKLVYASSASEMLEIYTYKDMQITLDIGYYTTLPKYSLVEIGGAKGVKSHIRGGRFIGLSCSDNFIYALYSKKDDDASIFEKLIGNEILVFDWAGVAIKKYKLDCEVKEISINKNEKIIYAIRDNPDPEVIYFEM